MRRWIAESSIYLLIGLGMIGVLWWQATNTLEGSKLLLAAAFVTAAAILIPARARIARMRRESDLAARERIDTFR